jgi:hypothetical protein
METVARDGHLWIERWGAHEGDDAYQVLWDGDSLRWSEVARLLRAGTMGPLLIEAMRERGDAAVFWECRPWPEQRDPGFQFVLNDAPALERMSPNPHAFAEHFDGVADGLTIRTFDNLGGDARLIAPCPGGRSDAYAHLAAFIQHGPPEQIEALWITLGEALAGPHVGTRWVSTSGLGVGWLHLRIDQRPKYYTYPPYRRGDFGGLG